MERREGGFRRCKLTTGGDSSTIGTDGTALYGKNYGITQERLSARGGKRRTEQRRGNKVDRTLQLSYQSGWTRSMLSRKPAGRNVCGGNIVGAALFLWGVTCCGIARASTVGVIRNGGENALGESGHEYRLLLRGQGSGRPRAGVSGEVDSEGMMIGRDHREGWSHAMGGGDHGISRESLGDKHLPAVTGQPTTIKNTLADTTNNENGDVFRPQELQQSANVRRGGEASGLAIEASRPRGRDGRPPEGVGEDVFLGEGDAPENRPSSDEDEADNDDGSTSASQETLLLTVYIVVGCGVVTLVVLCVIRKVMDLCLLRNDPGGSLRYSQEEGLAKSSIERLPQTKYKKPLSKPPKAAAAGARRSQVKMQQLNQGGVLEFGTASSGTVPEPHGGGGAASADATASAGHLSRGAGPAAAAAAGTKAEDRDSTEDMCAICLVDYEAGDSLRIIPGCRHQFHKECIDPWLETKAVCAYCKAKVEAKRSFCDRLLKSAQDRMGIHLVAPPNDLHHFSSNRRTYTSQEVRQMMGGPHLPPAYRQQSDLDYVGSMVVSNRDMESRAGRGGGARGALRGSGGAPGTSGGNVGVRRAVVGGEEPQGAIVVQPVSAPSFTVVPREFSMSSGVNRSGAADDGGGSGGATGGGVLGGDSGRNLGRTTDSSGNGNGSSRGHTPAASSGSLGGGGVGYGVRVERNYSGMVGADSSSGGDGGSDEEKRESEEREEKKMDDLEEHKEESAVNTRASGSICSSTGAVFHSAAAGDRGVVRSGASALGGRKRQEGDSGSERGAMMTELYEVKEPDESTDSAEAVEE